MQAVALGQLTPGPVLVTTTYIGYNPQGLEPGALRSDNFNFFAGIDSHDDLVS